MVKAVSKIVHENYTGKLAYELYMDIKKNKA